MKKLLAAAALAFGLGGGAASASTFDVTVQSSGLFGTVGYQKVAYNDTTIGSGEVRAGMFHLTGNNGVGDFVAFCVELTQYLNNPQQMTVNNALFPQTKIDDILKMFDSALMGSTMEAVFDTSVKAAGFQLALWEVVYETGASYDLTAGSFTGAGSDAAGAAVDTAAAAYLGGIPTGDETAVGPRFLESDDFQDLVTVAPIPLPAAGFLLAFGIAGLGFAGRRKAA